MYSKFTKPSKIIHIKSPYHSQVSSLTTILPFIFLFTLAVAQIPTAYDVLEEYDFPIGLLPSSVTLYSIDKDMGEFVVALMDIYSYSTDGYDLRFKSTITGAITRDKVTNIKGVSVKLLFFWMDIVEGTRHDDELDFSVGWFSAGFDVDAFEESPQCGCRFDCHTDLEIIGEKNSTKLMNILDCSH